MTQFLLSGARVVQWLVPVALLLGGPAWADSFNVTRLDDPAPNGCQPGDCSLREAVLAANATVGGDTIALSAGTHVVTLNGNDTDATGDLDVRSDLAILGPATIDGQNQGRIFQIEDDVHVTFEDLVLQNANSSLITNGALSGGAVQINGGSLTVRSGVFRENVVQSQGAGIYTLDNASLLVEDTVFYDNKSSSGAGIYATGDVTVRNSLFLDNEADLRGAALYLAGTGSDVVMERISLIDNFSNGSGGGAVLFLGRDLRIDDLLASGNECPNGNGGALATTGTAHGKSLSISNAIFDDNDADDGGALSLADDEDPVEIAHAAFVDNTATGQAGAIYTTGGLIDIANVTFSGNTAGTDGGAIHLFGRELALRHVTITGGSANRGSAVSVGGSSVISKATFANTIIEGDCRIQDADAVESEGGNLESAGNSCGFDLASDQVGVTAPALGLRPLQTTSGATPSHPLSLGSVAREAGVPALCSALPLDQLFRPRPALCSSGAVSGGFLLADGFESQPTLGSRIDFTP